jgi:hypothetical protein
MRALFLVPPLALAACAASATSAPRPPAFAGAGSAPAPPVATDQARQPICDARCRAAIEQLQRAADRLGETLSRANKAADP